ncbi:MAG: hypothetical protein M3460_22440 [Actinomycetota bacterium]|nr:hypothetical protein [Actinomycetota bacterium]
MSDEPEDKERLSPERARAIGVTIGLVYAITHTVVVIRYGFISGEVLISGIAGAMLIIAPIAFWTSRINKDLAKIKVLRRDRIAEARQHMDATGKLLRELEDELNTRIKVLEQLQAYSERYEQLASLNREQAKAIEDMVGYQFKRQERITWRQWWGAIVLAGILGFIINWASNPLWDWITR